MWLDFMFHDLVEYAENPPCSPAINKVILLLLSIVVGLRFLKYIIFND